MIAIFFLLILFAFTALTWLPEALVWIYSAMSIFLLLLYGLDKVLALKNKRRISENTLQMLALLGGWPGAHLGQQAFKHKVSKVIFMRKYWLYVGINTAALSGYLVWQYQQGSIRF
mgnify:FL=1